MDTAIALAFLLGGVLLGMGVCAAIWAAGEAAERRERIQRARRRIHSTVPDIRQSIGAA